MAYYYYKRTKMLNHLISCVEKLEHVNLNKLIQSL